MRVRQLELTQTAADGKRKAAKPKGKILTEKEAQVQAAIIRRLKVNGYEVYSTSRVRHKVEQDDGTWKWAAGGDGVDKGVPDLLFYNPRWPGRLTWWGLECKGTETDISPDQANLWKAGRILLARDQDSAYAQIQVAEVEAFGRCFGREARHAK